MPPPHFYKWLGTGGHREYKNSKQETDQTEVAITKALTKTTNCTSRAKKVEGHDQKISAALRRTCAPTFKFVPPPLCIIYRLLICIGGIAPASGCAEMKTLYQIRSRATVSLSQSWT